MKKTTFRALKKGFFSKRLGKSLFWPIFLVTFAGNKIGKTSLDVFDALGCSLDVLLGDVRGMLWWFCGKGGMEKEMSLVSL